MANLPYINPPIALAEELWHEREAANSYSRQNMQTITTTLKRDWFSKIVDGSKRVEYREIKPYWTTRLQAAAVPFRLVLRNGMLPPVPVVTVRIDRVVPSPCSKKRRGTYALHIGRVLKIEHWDKVKKRPK